MRKASNCDQCRHFNRVFYAGLVLVIDGIKTPCEKGHKPRFYKWDGNPNNDDWGHKRRCDDFEDESK